MIDRKVPRVVPTKPHYITLSIDGRGDTYWRLPSPAYALLIVQMMSAEGLVEKATSIAEGDSEAVASMGTSILKLYSIQGAIIGLCWFDKTRDLETLKSAYPTSIEGMTSYGEEVYEELYEAEWTSAQIVQTWSQLLPKVLETLVDQGKGIEKVNFTPAQQEHPAS